jgi:hypothetical protein
MALFSFCGLRQWLRGRDQAPETHDETPFSRASSLSTFSDLADYDGRRHSVGTNSEAAKAAKEAGRALAAACELLTSEWTTQDNISTTIRQFSTETTISASLSSDVACAKPAKGRVPNTKELLPVSNALTMAILPVEMESSGKQSKQETVDDEVSSASVSTTTEPELGREQEGTIEDPSLTTKKKTKTKRNNTRTNASKSNV